MLLYYNNEYKKDVFQLIINKYTIFKNNYKFIKFKSKKIDNRLLNYNFINKSINIISTKGFKKRYSIYILNILFIKIFFNKINNFSLIYFLHFIKIHKNIRKFSRGKSGKYKSVFKYIPFFKRLKTLLKIFFKEISLKKKIHMRTL